MTLPVDKALIPLHEGFYHYHTLLFVIICPLVLLCEPWRNLTILCPIKLSHHLPKHVAWDLPRTWYPEIKNLTFMLSRDISTSLEVFLNDVLGPRTKLELLLLSFLLIHPILAWKLWQAYNISPFFSRLALRLWIAYLVGGWTARHLLLYAAITCWEFLFFFHQVRNSSTLMPFNYLFIFEWF